MGMIHHGALLVCCNIVNCNNSSKDIRLVKMFKYVDVLDGIQDSILL